MLTDKQLKNLKAKGSKYRVFDNARNGFGVQVSAKGVISFFQYYHWEGKQRFMTLGRYPDTKLARARKKGGDARDLLDDGIDPQADRQRRIEETWEAETAAKAEKLRLESMGTVEALFDRYTSHLENEGKRSVNQVRRIWKADIKPIIGQLKAKDVTPTDIKRVLHPIIKRDAMVMANRTRSYLMAAFRFGIEWDNDPMNYDTSTLFYIETNPARDVPKPQKREPAANRALDESEIRFYWPLWGSAQLMPLTVGVALRLILATGGQRVEEVLKATWREFDEAGGLWEIPESRTKSGRSHVVPLTPLAIDVLAELKPISGGGTYLFPMRGDEEQTMQTNSLGNALRRFCRRFADYQKEWQIVYENPGKYIRKYNFDDVRTKAKWPKNDPCVRPIKRAFIKKWRLTRWPAIEPASAQGTEAERFTARDLRRTVKTIMGKMGISKDIRDRLQNHALTDVSSKHYDRYDYLREKRAVMDAWECQLRFILAGESADTNVIKMKKRN